MARLPIALQLYSVRHALAHDLHGTLRAVAAMGYEGVEFAGQPDHSAEELRAALDACGLACCGWHTPFALVQDDNLAETIAFHQVLGNRFLIVPGIPAQLRTSRADWLALAQFFTRLAEKLAPHDMVTGYHSHHVEFTPLEGERPWDTFFGNTDPRVVMQLDTGNAAFGGADVVDILRRYPGRARTVHLKPYSRTAGLDEPSHGFRPVIGQDELPWREIFQACETVGGTQCYIIEYESDAFPPLEAVARCLRGLTTLAT
jgi:sugar phosphate isomerase/epimerase